MSSFNYYLNFNKLNTVATKKGYFVSYREDISHSRVSHYLKSIEIKRENDIDAIYTISHELGHCYIYTRIRHKILNEITAWIIGFCICIKVRVPIKKRFFTLAYESLMTYWI